VDDSPRHRYRARRQQLEARRRRIALIACGVLLGLAVIGLAYRRLTAQPQPLPAPQAARTAAPSRPLVPTARAIAAVGTSGLDGAAVRAACGAGSGCG